MSLQRTPLMWVLYAVHCLVYRGFLELWCAVGLPPYTTYLRLYLLLT